MNYPELREKVQSKTANRQLGKPGDVADVIIFLLSDASAWMTGQVLTINGGSD